MMKTTKAESDYNMFDWWKKVVIENYANFDGRARRSEYWYFVLCNFIFSFTLALCGGLLGALISDATESGIGMVLLLPYVIYAIAIVIPSLAVLIRRFHDTNKSGWTILFYFIPLVGPILMIVFLATEGDRGANQYGLDPKGINHDFEIEQIGNTNY